MDKKNSGKDTDSGKGGLVRGGGMAYAEGGSVCKAGGGMVKTKGNGVSSYSKGCKVS